MGRENSTDKVAVVFFCDWTYPVVKLYRKYLVYPVVELKVLVLTFKIGLDGVGLCIHVGFLKEVLPRKQKAYVE